MNRQHESGQAMIFFAVMASALILTVGLAVEGGRMFVEFRRLQSAADMAALSGVQRLPGSDASALTDSCTYAFKNLGMAASCNSGNASASNGDVTYTVTSSVPPVTCSPYDFTDYNSGKSAQNGCASNPSTPHYFLEAQVSETTILPIPIFQVPITLSAHAVARAGGPGNNDFAIAVLDPEDCALDFGGMTNGTLLVVGSIISDSAEAGNSGNGCSITSAGGGTQKACGGGWYLTAPEAYPGGLLTYDSNHNPLVGTSFFAPPECVLVDPNSKPTPGAVSAFPADPAPGSYHPGTAPIPDPYCSSANPPTTSTVTSDCQGNQSTVTSMSTTCPACTQNGWVYSWDPSKASNTAGGRYHGTWTQAGAGKLSLTAGSSTAYELFPGIYPGQVKITGNNGQIFFNPGVYTIQTGFDSNGGTQCVYGAPVCDNQLGNDSNYLGTGDTCANADFTGTGATTNLVSSNSWYYYCSPWGLWDDLAALAPSGPPGILATAPTFSNGKLLNGVTFYVQGGNFQLGGNVGKGNESIFLAYPNACSGTSGPSGNTESVPFPAAWGTGSDDGNSNASYTYTANTPFSSSTSLTPSLPFIDHGSPPGGWTSPVANEGQVYPNTDLTLAGECANPPTVWDNEFGTNPGNLAADPSQHLHFLVWSRSSSSSIGFDGTGNETWWGILYNPGSTPQPAAGTSGCYLSCQTTITGHVSTPGGPPMFIGQIVADSLKMSGSVNAMVFYRPCTESQSCGSAPGGTLYQ